MSGAFFYDAASNEELEILNHKEDTSEEYVAEERKGQAESEEMKSCEVQWSAVKLNEMHFNELHSSFGSIYVFKLIFSLNFDYKRFLVKLRTLKNFLIKNLTKKILWDKIM